MLSWFQRRGYSKDGTVKDPQAASILESFLRTSRWNEAQSILEAHHKLLLSKQVLKALRARVEYRRKHPYEGDLSADELATHLEVLEDASRYGISTAWDRLTARRRHAVTTRMQPGIPQPPVSDVPTVEEQVTEDKSAAQDFTVEEAPGVGRIATVTIKAPSLFGTVNDKDFQTLLAALWLVDTPEGAYSLISHNREALMSLGFLMRLKQEASKYEEDGWGETSTALLQWHALLDDAQRSGLPAAWESHKQSLDFTLIRTQISQALENLLTARTPQDARQIIENQFVLIISSTAEQHLRAATSHYRRIGLHQLAEACESCLKLQSELRQKGANAVEDDLSALLAPLRAFHPFIPTDIPNNIANALRDMYALTVEQQASALTTMITSLHNDQNPLLQAVLHLRRGQVHAENESLPEYQERSLADFNAALAVLTREQWPICWATALIARSEILAQRFGGNQAVNLAQAYADDHAALDVVFPEILPSRWANIHSNVGRILLEPARERYAEEVEQAFAEFNLALTVFRRDLLPGEWAHTTMMKGIAYHRRVHDDRATNLELALEAYSAVLSVWTREKYPESWSMILHNRALIYRERLRGNHADNVELAIKDLTDALVVRTREAHPIYWAESHANRGMVYAERVMGDRLVNLKAAMQDINQALEVRTRTDMPYFWAQTLYYRANVHFELAFVSNEPAAELIRTLDDVTSCLEVYTETSAPWLWWHTLLIRARALELIGDYPRAHQAYVTLQRGYRALSGASWTDRGRLDILGHLSETDIYVRDAAMLLRQDPPDIEAAVMTLEAGRAQGLSAALSVDQTAVSSSNDPSVRMMAEELAHATAEWREAQHAASQRIDPSMPPKQVEDEIITRRQQLEASYTRYHHAREAMRWIGARSDENHEISLQDLAQAAPAPSSALVYLFAASRGGHAIVVHQDGDLRPIAQHIPLPDLTEDVVASLLLTTETREINTPDGTRHTVLATGGIVPAQMKLGRSILPAWGANLREAMTELPPRSGFRVVTQLLLDAWSKDPEIHHLTIRPFSALNEDEWQLIMGVFESTLLNLEISHCLGVLGRLAFNSLAEYLRKHELSTISLIPFGRLGLLPLSSARIELQGHVEYFCDAFDTRMAPSGVAVRACNANAIRLDKGDRPLILTLGNPKPHPPTIRDLPSAEAESQAVHDIALARAYLPEHILHLASEAGTKVNVVDALRRAWLAHLAVHGWYDVDDPTNSSLLLADNGSMANEDCRLYVYEALHGKLNLNGLRLLVLSACETAISDPVIAPDEALSIASGFLQAGAAGVIASLWAVDDEATYLLIARFFQLYLDPQIGFTPAQALAAAQKWLREEATNRVLAVFDPTQPAHEVRSVASLEDASALVKSPGSVRTGNTAVVAVSRSRSESGSANTLADIRATATSHAESFPDDLPYSEPIFWASFALTGC